MRPPLPSAMATEDWSAGPIRVLEQCQVSPPPGSVENGSFPLTVFDTPVLFGGYVERLFFYPFPHSTSHFISHHLPTLKSSLSCVLQHFYPLAGSIANPLRCCSDHAKYRIRFYDGGSISLTVAESSDDFQQVSGDHSREFSRLCSLIPKFYRGSPGSCRAAALQITVFPEQGISVGVLIHPAACDDTSFIHFMKSWAAACAMGGHQFPVLPLPLHDRTAIAQPDQFHSKILREALMSARPPPSPEDLAKQDDAVVASFALGREMIIRLKQGVSARAGEAGAAHVSTFTVACAVAWVCFVRARGGFYASKKSAHLLLLVECRGHSDLPVPAEYFGNCRRPCFVEVNVGDLVKDNGVFVAAETIGKAIEAPEDGLLKGAERWLQKVISLASERPMLVPESPEYRVYDVDFGWGRPVKVEMTSIKRTPGPISLVEMREEQGGIEIGLVLSKPEMDEFSSCFQNCLELLS